MWLLPNVMNWWVQSTTKLVQPSPPCSKAISIRFSTCTNHYVIRFLTNCLTLQNIRFSSRLIPLPICSSFWLRGDLLFHQLQCPMIMKWCFLKVLIFSDQQSGLSPQQQVFFVKVLLLHWLFKWEESRHLCWSFLFSKCTCIYSHLPPEYLIPSGSLLTQIFLSIHFIFIVADV